MEPLTILYRDEWLIAVDKPAGQLVHPADHPQTDDLVTMKILRDQIGQQVEVVHRLDRPTTGVLLFALEKSAGRKLRALFEKRQMEKIYHAVVIGRPAEDAWICAEPLRKNADSPERSAETEFRVLRRLANDFTLIEAKPKTGRFHQIRRHLLDAGHPIVGDYRYVGIERCDKLGEQLGTGTRMLLQAKSLHFQHPVTGEKVSIEVPGNTIQ